MRRLGILGLALVATVGLAAGAQAGLVSSALLAYNNDNDELLDYSWSAQVATAPGYGNYGQIVVGLARIDEIQTGSNPKISGDERVYIAFAFEVTGTVSGGTFDGWLTHSAPTVADYQLSTLLGSDMPSTAMMAIVELNDSPASGSNLAKFTDGQYATAETILGAFDEIESSDYTWIGAFGIGDQTKDFLYLSPFTYGIAVEVFGLSLLAPGPGLNAEDFNSLYPIDDDTFGIDETKYQLASNDVVMVQQKSGTTQYKYQGVTAVNYVPEPVSLIGLASLALTAGGLGLIRRRK